MKHRILFTAGLSILISIFLLLAPIPSRAEAIIADHSVVSVFETIPSSVINQIKSNFRIFYGHTSHGSQIVTGMDMIRGLDPLYDFNNGDGTLYLHDEYGDDLGTDGDTSWVPSTREHLNTPGENFNIVIWSWCGGVSGNSEEGINAYLDAMTGLEQDYPNVTFIFMTGHLDGEGPSGSLYINNNHIRQFCSEGNKVLFDFADIESYDPDGNYYPDGSDACEWCYTWCAAQSCPDCDGCAHSHCFNCYQKGKAFWWLLAKLAGWNQEPANCADFNGNGLVNIQDITHLINYLYRNGIPPVAPSTGDINGDSLPNIKDITYLINYLYRSGPAPICP